jgi:asparagine synthase (glutamine-hydrolysing)
VGRQRARWWRGPGRRQGAAHRGHVVLVVENQPVPRDRRVWAEARALAAAGYAVSVISPRGPDDAARERRDGVELHRYPAPRTGSGTVAFLYEYLYSSVMIAILLLRIRLHGNVDVVQFCNPPDTLFALAAPYKLFGARLVFDHHDLAPEMYMTRFGTTGGVVLRVLHALERLSFDTADHVISTNESFRQIALGRGRQDPSKVTVVRNGPEMARMARRPPVPELKAGKPYLCCWLGIMGPTAGVDLALDAAAHLAFDRERDDFRFVFLGDGERYDAMRRRAVDTGLGDIVTFTGWADDDTWFAYLSTADVGLLPLPRDPKNDRSTAIKAMEYMAFELPVVAFDATETRASAGDCALYAEPNDPRSFADCVARLLDDEALRRRLGCRGRQRITDLGLSWEHQRAVYVGVYDRLLANEEYAG